MAGQGMYEQLLYEVGTLYDAEQRFLDGQVAMLRLATNSRLQDLLRTHIDQTRGQIDNLAQIFAQWGEERPDATSAATQGLVRAAQQAMERAHPVEVRDFTIMGAAGKVEHFEIACYTSLIDVAQAVGSRVVSLLRKNLQQEQETARQLEQLAAQQLALLAPQLVEIVRRMEGAAGASGAGGGLLDGAAEDAAAGEGEEEDMGLNIAFGALQDETESPLSGGEQVP